MQAYFVHVFVCVCVCVYVFGLNFSEVKGQKLSQYAKID